MEEKDEVVASIELGAYPRRTSVLNNPDFLINRSIIGTYAPETPPLSARDNIACIGSCFAQEMAQSLIAQGKPVTPLFLSERWNTAFAVRHFVEYSLLNKPFPERYIQPGLAASEGNFAHDESLTQLKHSTAYIITLGLSLCWFEHDSNRMVLDVYGGHAAKGVARALTTHGMRQTSVSENVEQILAIIAAIRQVSASAPVIFTLSPVPLLFSLTDYPVIPSNLISKATLRIAIHEIMEQGHDGVFYWPSYEIVDWIGKHIGLLWGQEGNDLRHLQPTVVDEIMRSFSNHYFVKE
jgi:hypothetical protein